MNKKWQYIENDIELAKKISQKYGIGMLTAGVLANKNLTDEELKKKAEELRHEGNEVNIYKFITVRKKLKYEKVKI